MEKIIITDLEANVPTRRVWGNGEKVNRFMTAGEVRMTLATERAKKKTNLLWHGYEEYYNPDKKETVFINLIPSCLS